MRQSVVQTSVTPPFTYNQSQILKGHNSDPSHFNQSNDLFKFEKLVWLNTLSALLKRGGPRTEIFEELNHWVREIGQALREGKINQEDIVEIRALLDEDFLNNTVQGHAFSKPYGYAGDFAIIDKMYRQQLSDNPRYRRWDKYYHSQAAAKAVRNRKTYFKDQLKHILTTNRDQTIELLNIASGPARDLFELYEETRTDLLKTHCVDMDAQAIAFAQKLTQNYADQISFVHANIFRFRTEKQYDVIWSAGLFDYFDDKAFVFVLRRFKGWLKLGGEIIIGNFATGNPTRDFMEIFGDWHLHHRTPAQLEDLALKAGFEEGKISVGQEAEGVNLFLHIKN